MVHWLICSLVNGMTGTALKLKNGDLPRYERLSLSFVIAFPSQNSYNLHAMNAFFLPQMDYVHFLSGLALLIMALGSFALQREKYASLPWWLFLLYGAASGAGSWLSIGIIYYGAGTPLVGTQALVLLAAYLFLAEFTRRLLKTALGGTFPRWVILFLFACSIPGLFFNWEGLISFSRCLLLLPSAVAGAWALHSIRKRMEDKNSLLDVLAVSLAVTGLFSGAIVTPVPLLPWLPVDTDSFFGMTGIPPQMVSGLAAMAAAAAMFTRSRSRSGNTPHPRGYRSYLRQFNWIMLLLGVILAVGWILTDTLGRYARARLTREARVSIGMLMDYLQSRLAKTEQTCAAISILPWNVPVLSSGRPEDAGRADRLLEYYRSSFDMSVCYLMDLSGKVVASSNSGDPESFVGRDYGFRPYFASARAGKKGRYFALGVTSGKHGYYASLPVRAGDGAITGVAVVKKELDGMEVKLRKFPNCFLVDLHGVIFLSSRRELLFHSLWPLDGAARSSIEQSRQFGGSILPPLLDKQIFDGNTALFEDENDYVIRQFIGDHGWSLIVLHPVRTAMHYRLFGIIITLFLFVIGMVFYLVLNQSVILYEAHSQRKAVLDAATQVGIIATGPDGVITVFNTGAEKMLGYGAEEIVGRHTPELFHLAPEIAARARDLSAEFSHAVRGFDVLVEYARQGRFEDREWTYLCKNGSRITVDVSVTVRLSPDGRVSGFLFIVTDISDRKRMERALQQQLYFLQVIIDAIPNPVFFKDVRGVYIGCNAAFEKYLNVSRDTIIGKTVFELYPREQAEQQNDKDLMLFLRLGVQSYEMENKLHDGAAHHLLFNKATFMKSDGTLGGLVGVIVDITERRQAQKEKDMLHAQLLQSSKMASLGEMAGGIAHELNNPLSIILGYAQMVRNTLDPGDARRKQLGEIIDAANRSKIIITNLLGFARKEKVAFQPVLVNDIVLKTLSIIEYELTSRNIEIRRELTPNMSLINGNPTQLQQVFLNMIINARDAMPNGGTLTIATRQFGERGADISFSDTGEGIPAENIERIFDPFFTTKPVGKGTGLGLSICYAIIESHYGKISVKSAVGKGTSFTITIPGVFRQ